MQSDRFIDSSTTCKVICRTPRSCRHRGRILSPSSGRDLPSGAGIGAKASVDSGSAHDVPNTTLAWASRGGPLRRAGAAGGSTFADPATACAQPQQWDEAGFNECAEGYEAQKEDDYISWYYGVRQCCIAHGGVWRDQQPGQAPRCDPPAQTGDATTGHPHPKWRHPHVHPGTGQRCRLASPHSNSRGVQAHLRAARLGRGYSLCPRRFRRAAAPPSARVIPLSP